MRVGGDAKAAKAEPDEAQQESGPRPAGRRRGWLPAALLATGVVAILVVIALAAVLKPCVFSIYAPAALEAADMHPPTADLQIVARSTWTQQPEADLPRLRHPTPYVVVKHTASARCYGLPSCAPLLRDMRELHWQRLQQPDISYNFLVDSSGVVYEGRGWDATNVNKRFVLRCNLDVALIGNYAEQNVSASALWALQELLRLGVASGRLAPDYRLLAHSDIANTVSPGRWALAAIRDLPRRCLARCDEGVQCQWP